MAVPPRQSGQRVRPDPASILRRSAYSLVFYWGPVFLLPVGGASVLGYAGAPHGSALSVGLLAAAIVCLSLGVFLLASLWISKLFDWSIGEANEPADHQIETLERFDEVIVSESSQAELSEIATFLGDPRSFRMLGAKLPASLLLIGPSRSGKTTIARAIAGQARVPAFLFTPEDLVAGRLTAEGIRDLSDRFQPSVIILEDVDKLEAAQLVARPDDGEAQRPPTLTQRTPEQIIAPLLSTGAEGVIVVVTASEFERRARGRLFERVIQLSHATQEVRLQAVRSFSRDVPLGRDVDFQRIASLTFGFQVSDIQLAINEAAQIAATRGRRTVTAAELDEAILWVISKRDGVEGAEENSDERDMALATYAAGKALVARKLGLFAGEEGIVVAGPNHSRYLAADTFDDHQRLTDVIVFLLAGRAAEEVVGRGLTKLCEADLAAATKLAEDCVLRWGLASSLPIRTIDQSTMHEGSELFLRTSREISNLLDRSIERAREALAGDRVGLANITDALTTTGMVGATDFDVVLRSGPLPERPAYEQNTSVPLVSKRIRQAD